MRDNTVRVERTGDGRDHPSAIHFSPVFNVAVPFIDRHISEGRSNKTAIRTAEGDVTYGELADNVNRCGNALRSLGAEDGDPTGASALLLERWSRRMGRSSAKKNGHAAGATGCPPRMTIALLRL